MPENTAKSLSKQQFHNQWAHIYDHVYETSFSDSYARMTDASLKCIDGLVHSPGARIADLGAGTGRLTIPLVEKGFDVVAIEPSRSMLDVLERKLGTGIKGFESINSSMADFETASVDLAVCVFTVFTYVTDEDEMLLSLENIARHLKPGGLFLFDLASDLFFQNPIVMSHRSHELSRVMKMEPLEGEHFKITDDISGVHEGVDFSFTESFRVRRWEKGTISEYLHDCGMSEVDFDDSAFRFTGSRYLLFQQGGVLR